MLEEGSREKELVKRWFAVFALLLLVFVTGWKIYDNARLAEQVEQTRQVREKRRIEAMQRAAARAEAGGGGVPAAGFTPVKKSGPAPSFTLTSKDGTRHTLEKFRGRWVFIHFWFTTCPPCVIEMPALFDIEKRYHDKNMTFIAVSVDPEWSLVDEFWKTRLNGRELPFLHLLDPDAEVPRSFGTEKFPETWLVDPEGNLAAHFINRQDWTSAEATAWFDKLPGL